VIEINRNVDELNGKFCCETHKNPQKPENDKEDKRKRLTIQM